MFIQLTCIDPLLRLLLCLHVRPPAHPLPHTVVIRLLFSKQNLWHVDGKPHKCTRCVTWLSWIVALLYAGACSFIVGYVAINGLFTQDSPPQGGGGNNATAAINVTTLADMASQVTTCKIKETSDFAAEWAVLIVTSVATWVIVTRPTVITLLFFAERVVANMRRKREPAGNEGNEDCSTNSAVNATSKGKGKGKDNIGDKGGVGENDTGMVEMTSGHSRIIDMDDVDQVHHDNPMRRMNGSGATSPSENDKQGSSAHTAVVHTAAPGSFLVPTGGPASTLHGQNDDA